MNLLKWHSLLQLMVRKYLSELYNDGENFSTTISTNCTIVAMVAINMINDKKLKS